MENIELHPTRSRLFYDRRSAGRLLARALRAYRDQDVLVLAIPRGGVPVAEEVARFLDADLDVIVARKLGSPWSAELAIGAVTANGGRYLNETLIDDLRISDAFVARASRDETAGACNRERRFRRGHPASAIAGRTVIIIDDGIATGATVIAAARSVRQHRPAKLVVATPIASGTAVRAIEENAGEVVCLAMPNPFGSVGRHYEVFTQTSDEEVMEILERMRVPISAS